MVAVSLKKNFFKQKTAYEITTRLVGSEMCIRDRDEVKETAGLSDLACLQNEDGFICIDGSGEAGDICLLYTSDAADD